MPELSKHRVLIAGINSPVGRVAVLYSLELYAESGHGWFFQFLGHALGITILVAMSVLFLVTTFLALRDHRRHSLSLSATIGLLVAVFSLGIPAMLVRGVTVDWKQYRNMAMHDVPAPVFRTLDRDGNVQSLSDPKGKVVWVNIWATLVWLLFG
jgi:hypothetical protein